jgi:ABC-type sugar transport system ATPase subunit
MTSSSDLRTAGADHPLLEMRRISKSFGGVVALDSVDLAVEAATVHAIVGENGAGKSTLMKVLAGAMRPDGGETRIEGEPVALHSPYDSVRAGISTVYQEPPLYPELSVLENFQMGFEERNRFGGIAWRSGRERAAAALARFQIPARVLDRPMRRLSLGLQQLVLIARALSREPRILILDEPTSMLSSAETDRLFDLVDELRADGTAVLYISHRLPEILRIADRITVLRDGRRTGELERAHANEDALVELMSGRRIGSDVYRAPTRVPRPVLEVRGLSRAGAFRDVDFDLHEGEILGLYGLVGAGRSELAQAIFGSDPPSAGECRLNGEPIAPRSAREGIRLGIAYLGEDRRSQGSFPLRSVADNLTAAILGRLTGRLGRLDGEAELVEAARAIEDLRIRTPDARVPLANLSGGSQQKVMFARWLLPRPQVLILDEPTRGIDIGTKAQIHQLIIEQAREQGRCVLLISSEIAEVLAVSDRVVVMHGGEVQRTLSRSEATEQAVLRAALGIERQEQGVA